jgi:hypothetical protein
VTPLTEAEQLEAMREAVRIMDSTGNAPAAFKVLTDAIERSPTESRCYPALVGSANWFTLGSPQQAVLGLAGALLELEPPAPCACDICKTERPKMTKEEHARFPGGRW